MTGQNDIFERYGQRPYTLSYTVWDKEEKKHKTRKCVAGIHEYQGMLCGHITKNKTLAGYWCWDKARYQKPVIYFGREQKKMGYSPSLKHAIMRMAEQFLAEQSSLDEAPAAL